MTVEEAQARYRQALKQLLNSIGAPAATRHQHAGVLRQACTDLLAAAHHAGCETEIRAQLAADWAGLATGDVMTEMLQLAAPR